MFCVQQNFRLQTPLQVLDVYLEVASCLLDVLAANENSGCGPKQRTKE